MIWDIWTSIAIAYDMVMTPMDAFKIEVTGVPWQELNDLNVKRHWKELKELVSLRFFGPWNELPP